MFKDEKQAAEWRAKYGKVIAKAWADPAFRANLLANPAKVLAEEGLHEYEGLAVEIHEDTPEKIHLVLPRSPEGELTEEVLESVAAAGCGTPNTCYSG